jgi:hypothetical protein
MAIGVLNDAGDRLHRESGEPQERYIKLLIKLHQIVRGAVPMMEAAVEAAEILDDPVSRELAKYLKEHIVEEKDHDVWILKDLEVLGIPESLVTEEVPDGNVAALVGSQYYWIRHYHPCAVLGYMAIMEGFHITTEAIEKIHSATRFPRSAFRTLDEHASLDIEHADEFWRVVDRLSFSQRHESLLRLSALSTITHYAAVLRNLPD